MTFDLKTALKYIILFSLGVGVLYFAFRGQDLTRIWQEIKSANYFWVTVSTFSVLLAHLLRALRWQMLYRSMQYKVVFHQTYHAVMVGYLANLALPRFGEIARCSVIHKTSKVPMFVSIGTVITERLFDLFVLLAFSMAVIFFQYHQLRNFLNEILLNNIASRLAHTNYWLILTICMIAGILLCLAFYLLNKYIGRKLLRIFVSLRQGFRSYRRLKEKRLFWIYTLGIWIFYILSMYTCFFALEATSFLHIDAAFTAIVFSGFAMAAPVQGGIGVFHWMVAKALLLYLVPFKDGLAYAALIHSSQLLLILILGSISLSWVISRK